MMTRIRKILFALSVAIFGCQVACWAEGAESDCCDSVALKVYFKQGKHNLEPAFRDNEERLKRFVSQIEKYVADSTYVIKDVVITSSASPEGRYNANMELSRNRGRALQRYLSYSLNIPDSLFRINAIGEDWDGLRELVMKYDIPRGDEVVKIIDSKAWDRKKRLMDLAGGAVWNYMLKTIFPELRNGNNCVECHIVKRSDLMAAAALAAAAGAPSRVDTVYVVPDMSSLPATMYQPAPDSTLTDNSVVKKARKPYFFAVKTNALYDLALTPNVELEFPIGEHVSIMAEHWFPWYFIYKNKHAWELLYTGGEVRWWFSKPKTLPDSDTAKYLNGWFLGVYGGGGKYDFEFNDKGRQGTLWSAGVSVGKSWYLGRRWRFEASLGLGYMRTDFKYYEHNDKVDLLIYKYSGNKNWFGPTKAKLSFSYLIGGYNRSRTNKEGGSR